MKKTAALILALLMLTMLFASCKNNGKGGDTTVEPGGTATPDGYTVVNETVYATTSLNIRSAASTDSTIVKTLAKGESVLRIGISQGGEWSKVLYNGQTCYAYSEYLSREAIPTSAVTTRDPSVTDAPPVEDSKFVENVVNTTVYVTFVQAGKDVHNPEGSANIYDKPSKDIEPVGTIKDGEAVKRLSVYYEPEHPDDPTYGWSKIEYKGATYYIRNSQLKISFDTAAATTTTATTTAAASPT